MGEHFTTGRKSEEDRFLAAGRSLAAKNQSEERHLHHRHLAFAPKLLRNQMTVSYRTYHVTGVVGC